MPPAPRMPLAAMAAAALAVTAATAVAEPAWLPPQTLSPDTGDAVAPSGGLDASGGAVVVWQQAAAGGQSAVMATTRAPGGSWAAPAPLSAPGDGDPESPGPAALDPVLAVAPGGRAVAVWRFRDGGGHVVEANVRAPGGGWIGPQVISRAARRFEAPAVAVDADGNAVAAWVRQGQESASVQVAVRPADGVWSPAVTVSAPGASEVSGPAVAAGRGGVAVAWAWRGGPGDLWRVQGTSRAANGPWAAAQDLSTPGPEMPGVDVAVDGAGHVNAAWNRTVGTASMVQIAEGTAGSAWGAPVAITDPDGSVGVPRLTALAGGGLVMAVTEPLGVLRGDLLVRERTAEGNWGLTTHMGDPAALAANPRLAARADGGAVIAFDTCPMAAPCQATTSLLPPRGAWQEAGTRDTMTVGSVAGDAEGNLLLVGTRFQDAQPSAAVRAVVYDPAGPSVAGLAVPDRAVAGTPLNMSLVAVDAWSALGGDPRWEFSDGTQATGQQVTHTFASAGDQAVTVSQADALGNVTRVTRAIRVDAQSTAGGEVSGPSSAPSPPSPPSAQAFRVHTVRAGCPAAPSAAACRVSVSFRLGSAGRVAVRVALRGRRGAFVVTMDGRAGLNMVRLPRAIAGVPLRPGTRLAVQVTAAPPA